MLIDIEN